jgi:plastocyanin
MRNCFQKGPAVGLGALLILCLTVITGPAQSKYAKGTDDAASHAAAAAKVLKKIMGTPDKAILRDLLNKAEAIVAVFPDIPSESGNNTLLLEPEGMAALSKELGGRTDPWSQADLEAVPADATLPGEAGVAKPGALAVVKVSMRNMQFYPQTLNVKKGTVVEWKNDDLVPHTVTSASFDSGSLGPGKSWRHAFTKAGQFSYVCTFHPTMTGVVIVK